MGRWSRPLYRLADSCVVCFQLVLMTKDKGWLTGTSTQAATSASRRKSVQTYYEYAAFLHALVSAIVYETLPQVVAD